MQAVTDRFRAALGVRLTASNAPGFLRMMERVRSDSEDEQRPIKLAVKDGGRPRPLLDYPRENHCSLAHFPSLPETGAYPSGHAAMGWLWGNILAELAPDRAGALRARGWAFGQSRVICGFHWQSDVIAGRLTAAVLLDRLEKDPDFMTDLAVARGEIQRARKGRRHA